MRVSLLRRMLLNNLLRNGNQQANSAVSAASQTNRLKKIDLAKDWSSLNKTQQMYIQKMIEKNNERYAKEKKLRTHYRISAGVLFTIVFSIYFYSMYAVKQEKFLDDFDVPTPPDVKDTKK